MQLLYPFQVDHWNDADEQVDMARHIDLLGHDGAMQPFIEEQVGLLRKVFPGRESARLLAMALRLRRIVQIAPEVPAAALSVKAEELLEVREQVGIGSEMAELVVSRRDRPAEPLLH